MFNLFSYDYNNRTSHLIATGCYEDILSQRESYLSFKIEEHIGKIYNIDSYICPKKSHVDSNDYDKTPIYISKSLNNSTKLTLNIIHANTGYLYTDYISSKILSVYILPTKTPDNILYSVLNKPLLKIGINHLDSRFFKLDSSIQIPFLNDPDRSTLMTSEMKSSFISCLTQLQDSIDIIDP